METPTPLFSATDLFTFLIERVCSVCHGTRLNPNALSSHLGGRNLAEISAQRAEQFLNTFYFQYGHRSIADLAHIAFAIERLSTDEAAQPFDLSAGPHTATILTTDLTAEYVHENTAYST